MNRFISILSLLLLPGFSLSAHGPMNYSRNMGRIYLDSQEKHNGNCRWRMCKSSDVNASGEKLSVWEFDDSDWLPAIVPGTVLHSLVYNGIYPEPYYGLNNHLKSGLIPDLSVAGKDFYTYWFRTQFDVPVSYRGKQIWMLLEGINYRAEVWVNGNLLTTICGMFRNEHVNITEFVKKGGKNVLAIKIYPVDMPGMMKPKSWGASGEFHNGGDGNIGLNTTMLMSVGWDFTFMDGIRDRNTGIWRSISLYATGPAVLRSPFVKSSLSNNYTRSAETVVVEVTNASQSNHPMECVINGKIEGTDISFSKKVRLYRQTTAEVEFNPSEYPQLIINHPRLWWPVNKGGQELYELKMSVSVNGEVSDSLSTRFGIREITSDRNTPDRSRQFYVNGKRLFVRGTNWIPEAMLRSDDRRMYAEMRYTQQAGINLIRLWGGGIAESDYFYQLCDEMGFLVWQEFFMTGNTKHPQDHGSYLNNVVDVIKRIRNHPSVAYYVSSNESSEMPFTEEMIRRFDGTRGYQRESECDGIHDGSPYKQVNPMQHYENTASDRGSRIDGFNPEYGAPTLPLVESLREMMAEKDLWPINKEVWDYHDGGGFHLMTSLYKALTDQYGESSSIEEFAAKAQFLGAMNSKSIWESWNYNKLDYGDRYTSGVLFWYHQCPVPQVAGRMWDYLLEPTASLYHTMNALEPLHPQFDYLKNTVSVINDYYRAIKGYTLTAEVYDMRSRKIWEKSVGVDVPEDGVANDILAIEFPADVSSVHFIKLRLLDEEGRQVGSNFYWRSTDKYLGKNTLTGPAASGFEPLAKLPPVALEARHSIRKTKDAVFIDVELLNNSEAIAFFTQLQLLDQKSKPVRPSYYTDNFFSLLPGESKKITIETAKENMTKNSLVIKGWNILETVYKL